MSCLSRCLRRMLASNSDGGDRFTHVLKRYKLEDFVVLAILGEGAFGQVYLAQNRITGRLVALKCLGKEHILRKSRAIDAFIERNVMLRLRYRYTLFLYGTFQTEHHLYYVMDFLPGGTLKEWVKSRPGNCLSITSARNITAQVVSGLMFLHSRGVLYRDLKPENILFTRAGTVVLADFGLSKDCGSVDQLEEEGAVSVVGSPHYIAPEVLNAAQPSASTEQPYGPAADWWSFGVLVYALIYGKSPFASDRKPDVYRAVREREVQFPVPRQRASSSSEEEADMCDRAVDLCRRLLQRDIKRRLTGEDVKTHPFFSGLAWSQVEKGKIDPPEGWHKPPPEEELVRKYRGYEVRHRSLPSDELQQNNTNSTDFYVIPEPASHHGNLATREGIPALDASVQNQFKNFTTLTEAPQVATYGAMEEA